MFQRDARRHALRIMQDFAVRCAEGVSARTDLSDADRDRLRVEFEQIANYYASRLKNPRLFGPRPKAARRKLPEHQPVPGQLSIEDVPA